MEKRELICIGCPMGCPLTVTLDGGAVVTVQGNTCPRGDAYARREVTAPTRIVTTTVRVTGGTLPAVSCKTRSDIPKEKIFDVVNMRLTKCRGCGTRRPGAELGKTHSQFLEECFYDEVSAEAR